MFQQLKIPYLKYKLHSRDPRRRIDAIKKLAQLSPEQALVFLGRSLNDSDASVRLAVVRALGNIGNSRMVDRLAKALSDKNALDPFFKVLDEGDPEICCAAIEVLRKIDDPRAVEPLIKALIPAPIPDATESFPDILLGRGRNITSFSHQLPLQSMVVDPIQLAAAKALKNSTDPRTQETSIQSRIDIIFHNYDESILRAKLRPQIVSSFSDTHGSSDQGMLTSPSRY